MSKRLSAAMAVAGLVWVLALSGCLGYDEKTVDEDEEETLLLRGVEVYNAAGETGVLIFEVDDEVTFRLFVYNAQLNTESVIITWFVPFNSDTPFIGPETIALEEQTSVEMVYDLDPETIRSPVGNWKVRFEVEDAAGNQSNVVEILLNVQQI